MSRPLYVSYPSPNTFTTREWAAKGAGSRRSNARAHARKHGAATVLRADGSGIIFYHTLTAKTVRQITRRDMRPVTRYA